MLTCRGTKLPRDATSLACRGQKRPRICVIFRGFLASSAAIGAPLPALRQDRTCRGRLRPSTGGNRPSTGGNRPSTGGNRSCRLYVPERGRESAQAAGGAAH